MGDFYECYSDDAVTASRVLGLVQTKKSNGDKGPVAMAGFPHHALEGYLTKLIRAGFKVAVCDQLASVVRPMKELAAFKRVSLKPGESKEVEIEIPYRRFALWDKDMNFRVEEGWFEVWLGKNADEKALPEGRVYVR